LTATRVFRSDLRTGCGEQVREAQDNHDAKLNRATLQL